MRFSYNTPKGIIEEMDKWVTSYKQIDGKWKLAVGIDNSDKPLSGR